MAPLDGGAGDTTEDFLCFERTVTDITRGDLLMSSALARLKRNVKLCRCGDRLKAHTWIFDDLFFAPPSYGFQTYTEWTTTLGLK
jgi:hypothetical protein